MPFQLMLNDEKEMSKLYIVFVLSEGETYKENGMYLSLIKMTDFYAYVYETFTGEVYTNDFIRDGYSYDTEIMLSFRDDSFDVDIL